MHVRPPPLPRSESSEKIKNKIEELRAKLQANHKRLAIPRKRNEEAKAPATARGERPPNEGDPLPVAKPKSRPHTGKAAATTSPQGTNRMPEVRVQLKSSLVEHATQSNYISMFPPLFTPYDRSNNLMRGWGGAVKEYYEKTGKSATSGPPPPTLTQPPEEHDNLLGLAKKPLRRAKGVAGKPGFYPTGTSVTAYRHYTNYRLALELDHQMQEHSGKSLQQLFRAHASQPRTPPKDDLDDLAKALPGPRGDVEQIDAPPEEALVKAGKEHVVDG
eukprot:Sspe_Gene.42928::Locus_20884_Transcript_1_1_Confidence_1.000_Length_1345::g.42928::m.42928